MTDTLEIPAGRVDEELGSLIDRLNRTDGFSFVYEVLEVIARLYRLDDAIIRLESTLGGGFFRLHRAPVGHELARSVPPGPRVFVAEPDVVPPQVAQTALDLCVLALRLCISRHSRYLDRQTGLLAERSFDNTLGVAAAQAARHGWIHTLVVLDVAGSDAEAAPDDLRLFGRALRQSLRSGDVASRIEDRRFAALLANAGLDAVNPFLARVYGQLGSGRASVVLSVGAATSPAETIDPAELRRLAFSRLQPGALGQVEERTILGVSLWEYLELELRLLPPVVHVARVGPPGGREVISIMTGDPSPSVEAAARRIVEAHGLDVDFEFDVLRAPDEPEVTDGRKPVVPVAAAGRPRIAYTSTQSVGDSGGIEVRLVHRGSTVVGRSNAGELRGSAEATIKAVGELGIGVPLTLDSVSTAKGVAGPSPVRVVLTQADGHRFVGIARGASNAEAASRATLGALNGFLDGVVEEQPH
jgi:GGDEF domain-containing protein